MCSTRLARALDRLNVAVVAWRLRQDPRFSDPAGAGPMPSGSPPSGPPRRADVRGRRELWTAAGSDWVATRVGANEGTADRATVLLHGWLATRLQLAYYGWLAKPLVPDGELWLPRLPAHAERTPPGSVSGSRCVSPDPEWTARSIRQAVVETRWLTRWLQDRGRSVSLWGISLGGWVAALAASEPVCDRLVLWEPVVDPIETASSSPLGRVLADASGRRVDDPALADALRELVPARRDLALPGARVLVVGGSLDNVVRHDSLASTTRRWGARFESFEQGHISLLLSRRARQSTLAWLRA